MASDRPNVVFVITDQQQAQALGAVDPSFSTPHLDALAEEGTLFESCYCTLPQCSPSRSSLMTGQYPHQTGVNTLTNWGPYDLASDAPSVARAFRDNGYETVWGGGRWDLGAENLSDLGWQRTRNVDITGSTGKEGVERDARTVEASTDYIRHHADDGPFFLTASFNLPHPPFYEDDTTADRYDLDAVPLPENIDDDLDDKPSFHADRADQDGCSLSPEEYREVRYQYRTMVSRIDDQVGQIIDALEEAGVYDETIIAFTSDHGDMQGAHGLNKKGVFAYEEILQVPLILRVPGQETVSTVSDLVSHVSLPATLLDAADLGVPDDFEGDSFLSTLSGDAPPSHENVFFEHKYAYWGHHPYRGVRTPDWKFVEYLADEGNELYHLSEDPHEMINLAGDPEYEDVQARLRTAVEEWWRNTDGDVDDWVNSPIPDSESH